MVAESQHQRLGNVCCKGQWMARRKAILRLRLSSSCVWWRMRRSSLSSGISLRSGSGCRSSSCWCFGGPVVLFAASPLHQSKRRVKILLSWWSILQWWSCSGCYANQKTRAWCHPVGRWEHYPMALWRRESGTFQTMTQNNADLMEHFAVMKLQRLLCNQKRRAWCHSRGNGSTAKMAYWRRERGHFKLVSLIIEELCIYLYVRNGLIQNALDFMESWFIIIMVLI